ncbi:hypothetical protein DL768_001464 [Monosporascus sp. mg162]|nr:hypothetical protein DL768_001464 [Monosporascus sp. mg162]
MENAEEELKRRRERGRLAQRAFRRRQAQAQQDIKAENSSLRGAIADILTETREVESPLLRMRILRAAAIAGLRSSSPVTQRDSLATVESSAALQREDVGSMAWTAEDWSSAPSSSSLSSYLAPLGHDPLSSWTPHNVLPAPRLQPEDYIMIHPDPFHCHQSTNGAALVLQFLGPAAFTFAGCIFWHIIGKQEALLRAQANLLKYKHRAMRQQHLFMTGRSDSFDEPSMVLSELVPVTGLVQESGPEDWLSMIERRLDHYRLRGQRYAATHAGRQPVPGPLYTPSSSFDELSHRWLTPLTIEQRIRAIVGDALFAVLVSPAVNRFEQDNGYYIKEESKERGEAVLIDGLLDLLSENFVCRGTGPLWDTAVFDQTFAWWFASVTGNQPAAYGR